MPEPNVMCTANLSSAPLSALFCRLSKPPVMAMPASPTRNCVPSSACSTGRSTWIDAVLLVVKAFRSRS